MDEKKLYDGLLMYLCLVMIVTFHEFGHAWTAYKCGDRSQIDQGRVTLNPLAHMEVFGTVILPLFFLLMAAFEPGWGGFLFGWGKPVMVNLSSLKNRKRDDLLVTLAGPGMNVVLAIIAILIARGASLAGQPELVGFVQDLAMLSMFLCFFNLLPIPPLDGGNVARVLLGMKEETYLRLSHYGWIFIIVLINIRPVFILLGVLSLGCVKLMSQLVGLG
jgi:Zn-dependent protease